eukprot:CAMPEP_0173403756 /NCGR_PEP_ID=MMETSP1356-20130122/57603_1 /TAXON_ID=77927 ORGANISM="Hemiselmis virescens, Strain PCC157" /NCGR_SAMPLE_ID=MMETSP1356 /ASSEMBLY_ACC=CAM_ASM_000847 /LENGTH=38 /DNA_ID= /DNA_START= /DNA_END= /DNA_ORIENTATION=
MRRVFREWDKDQDGFLQDVELKTMFMSHGAAAEGADSQ